MASRKVLRKQPPAPDTLADLLTIARGLADSGLPQAEIIETVSAMVAPLGVQVHHDLHEWHTLQPTPAKVDSRQLAVPTDAGPTSAGPSDAGPADVGPTSAGPTDMGPADAGPSDAGPTDMGPTDARPTDADSANASPTDADSRRLEPKDSLSEARPVRKERYRGKKAVIPVEVTTVRQRDGTHKLNLGALFDLTLAETKSAGKLPTDEGPAPNSHQSVSEWQIARLVLCSDKSARRGGGTSAQGRVSRLFYECNGVVVDARTWRVLAMPPGAFNRSPSAKAVDAHLSQNLYDIIRADDGTVVTLYSWEGPAGKRTWSMATSGAYDVSSLHWIGPLTYAEILYDLVVRLYPEFKDATGMDLLQDTGKPVLTFSKLDDRRCYTIGFRHWNFHPLRADPERVWQIQSCDCSEPGVPGRGPGVLPAIPQQTTFRPAVPITLATLRASGGDALAAAAAYIATPRGAVAAPLLPPPELNYGIILRSRDTGRTGIWSDVLIETALLDRIRRIAYERPHRADRDALSPAETFIYAAWRALLKRQQVDFLALYPEWSERMHGYSAFLDNVVTQIVHAIRARAMAPAAREPALKTPTGRVAAALLDHITRCETVSAFHADLEAVVRDYVINPQYALLFLRACK